MAIVRSGDRKKYLLRGSLVCLSLAGGLLTAQAAAASVASSVHVNEDSTPTESSSAVLDGYAGTAVLGKISLEQAVAFRNDVGLPSGSSYLTQVAQAQGVDVASYGVPLLPAEVAELDRRDVLSDYIDVVRQSLGKTGTFGGGWVDHKAGGVLVIALVGGSDASKSTLLSILPREVVEKLRIVNRPTTEVEFEALPDRIFQESPDEWKLQQVTADTVAGVVRVSVPIDAPENVEAQLHEKYGAIVTTAREDVRNEAVAVNRNFTSGPLYGGTRTSYLRSGVYKECTAGYANVRDSSGQFLLLTAGHCGNNGDQVFRGVYPNIVSIGTIQRDQVVANSVTNCDCAVVGQIPGGTGTESWLLNGNSVERFQSTNPTAVTDVVCQSGASMMQNGGAGVVQCGTVSSRAQDALVGGKNPDGSTYTYTMSSSFVANLTCIPGDSAGPVGNNAKLNGIVSYASGQNYTSASRCAFSNIYNVPSIGVTLGF